MCTWRPRKHAMRAGQCPPAQCRPIGAAHLATLSGAAPAAAMSRLSRCTCSSSPAVPPTGTTRTGRGRCRSCRRTTAPGGRRVSRSPLLAATGWRAGLETRRLLRTCARARAVALNHLEAEERQPRGGDEAGGGLLVVNAVGARVARAADGVAGAASRRPSRGMAPRGCMRSCCGARAAAERKHHRHGDEARHAKHHPQQGHDGGARV